MRLRDGRDLSELLQTGTFATRIVVHGSALVALPVELPPRGGVPDRAARSRPAWAPCSRPREVWEGRPRRVIGCGAVGLSVIQGARIAGASEIYAIDLDERKLDVAAAVRRDACGPEGRAARLRLRRGRPAGDGSAGPRMLGHAGTLVYIGLPQPGSEAIVRLEDLFDRRYGSSSRTGATTSRRKTSRSSRSSRPKVVSTWPEWSRRDRAGRHRAGLRRHGGR